MEGFVSIVQNKTTEKNAFHVDPALWIRFASAGNQDEYCRSWLALQCSLISNAIQGILVIGSPEDQSFAPVSKWPDEGEDSERLAEISERVLEERCGLVAELNLPEGQGLSISPHYGIAYPILVDDNLHGLIAVEVLAGSEEQLKSFMEHLQWGASWMELMFRRRQAHEDEGSLTRLKSAVDILASVLSEKTFDGGSMAFVTEMATHLNCDRVSLAFMHKKRARIQAVSHSAQIEKNMNLIRAIGMAMDEAIVQRKEIFYPLPPDQEVLIVRDHAQLAKQHGAGAILTMPFYADEKYHGALSLERPAWQPFTDEEAKFCRSVASLLFPVLEATRRNDRLLILKIWDALKAQTDKLFGPHYQGRKMLAVIIVAVILFFSFKAGDYKISADTVLEGAIRRVVVAPFDGYVKEASVRAGDLVESGTRMCTLDDKDLRLERLNWLSKRTQYQRQHQEALAEHNRAEAKIIKAQLEQATARLNLVESQLERTRIVAPFKGIVVSGDLSQRLGGSLEKGEILFEVAPLNAYRVILEVDERRIADVSVGQQGRMVLSALPQEHFDFVVEKITPISAAKEGLNYFRVEARPENISGRLRPGMEGVGKIHVDRRNMVSIWTRDLREWLRLWVWSWWP
jgi:hypothetical protein